MHTHASGCSYLGWGTCNVLNFIHWQIIDASERIHSAAVHVMYQSVFTGEKVMYQYVLKRIY